MADPDCFGLDVTLADPDARAGWEATVRGVLSHGRTAPEHLGRVLDRAPDFAMGWALKGLATLLLGRAELVPAARAALGRAQDALARAGGTARERGHVAALEDWLAGRPGQAADRLAAVLEDDPRDLLAFKLDHAIRFVLGDRRGMERMARRIAPVQDPTGPMTGFVLGCLAFALEENGAHAEAERLGRAGLELAPDDAWGLHAVAHVKDMTGRARAGIAWLEPQEARWAHCNNFGAHVWWHLALFHLELGEHERVLALYDTRVRAEHTDDYRDIANAASLLVRLGLEGVDAGDRWEELADLAAARVEPGCLVFADLHYLMALLGAGREAEAGRLIARLGADAGRDDHAMHEVAGVAGHPAALGLAAFRAGRFDLAYGRLSAVRPALSRIGGSHAQRDVFSRLMIEAAIRAGLWEAAEEELRERASRRGGEDGFTARRRAAIASARARAAGTAAALRAPA